MTPHKVILYSVNDGERGLLAFTLKHRLGLDVRQCLEWAHIAAQLRENDIRGLLIIHEGRSEDAKQATAAILSTLKRDYPEIPLLLVDTPNVFDVSPADIRLPGIVKPMLLIGTLKTLVARKPGPKKQTPAKQAAPEAPRAEVKPEPKPKPRPEAVAPVYADASEIEAVDLAEVKSKLRRGVPMRIIAELFDVKLSAIERIAAEMRCASAA